MRRNTFARSTLRCAHFERFEDRLVFSSVLLSDVGTEPAPELISTSPEWVELAPTTQSVDSVAPASASLAHVRNTYGFYGEGQTVAIIDSGIAWDHVALGGGLGEGYHVVGGWDFTEENDANPYDDGPAGFHGTHVAGIVASQDATRMGVAPGVDLVALRVFNDQGLGYNAWVEKALDWIDDHQDDFRFPITTVNLSLGAQWNNSAPPDWATLEDKLAQLVSDGIFISVAAGNSFSTYGTPGLAYPAASPYVVPVASVGDDGQLSAFSQRDVRVLAAPGEYVTSTVPDYIFGVDGKLDDWAAASGTSMAAPYLAGASVLVREAMQFVGTTSITQADIYQHLRDTSDQVFDPETGEYYQRLNLARAIDSLLPQDDYSSSLDAPFDLGLLQQTQTVSGQLARLDDQDAFQFTASTSGELSWDANGCFAFDIALMSDNNQVLADTNRSSVHVDAGQSYTFVVSACERLTDYELTFSVTSPQLVTVTGNRVQVNGTSRDDTIRFWIDDSYRLEVNGQQYSYTRDTPWQFEILGGGGEDQLTLSGSEGSDTVILRAGSAEMSGSGYAFTADGFSSITATAGEGLDDVVRMFGTTDSDLFLASPTDATMSGRGYTNRAEGFDRVYGYANTGNDDVARFYDSAGNDEFIATPRNGTLRGAGYFIKAWSFDRLYAYASTGQDTARLFDSMGDEQFVATPEAGSMQGDSFLYKAWNFDRLYAYASGGGDDVARLYDSVGNEQFIGTPKAATMQGESLFYKAWHFDQVYAYASGGANDVARLYGSAGDDVLYAGATNSTLQGDAYFYKARQFDRVYASPDVEQAAIASLPSSERTKDICSGIEPSSLRVTGLSGKLSTRTTDRNLVDTPAGRELIALLGYGVWHRSEDRVEANTFESKPTDSRWHTADPPAPQHEPVDLAVAIAAIMRHERYAFHQPPADVDGGQLGEFYLAALDDLFESLE